MDAQNVLTATSSRCSAVVVCQTYAGIVSVTPARRCCSRAARTRRTSSEAPHTRLVTVHPRPLLALDTQHGKTRRRRYGRGLGIEPTANVLLTNPRHKHRGPSLLRNLQEKREPKSGLWNRLLLLQLRVLGQGLLSVARVCKTRMSKGFSVLSIAWYCRVLRAG
jgi:hypothetical protein